MTVKGIMILHLCCFFKTQKHSSGFNFESEHKILPHLI